MTTSTFKYKAIDAAGKTCRGEVTAAGESEAYRKVAAAGLTPLKFTRKTEKGPTFSWQRVKVRDICVLTRELSSLIDARIPLDRGLMSIAEHEPKPLLASMLRTIAARLEAGSSMSEALQEHKASFGDVYIETVKAAEKSGNLSLVMAHLADLLEKEVELRSQIRRAMMYPIIVMSVVAIAVSVIVVFVVPKFAQTFREQGVKMPLMTRLIQAVGESAKEYWWAYLLAIAGGIAWLSFAWASRSGRLILERAIIRLPYIGRIMVAGTASRFAHVMSIGLASGLDIIDSVQMSSRATARPVFINECAVMIDRLRRGEELSEVIKATSYLPNFAKRMISAGKDSTELSKACGLVARHFDRESSDLTKNINTVIEPLLTVAMAVIVLIVALSVFLPMWQMVRLHK